MNRRDHRQPLAELWAVLAEGDAESPPSGLAGRVLDAALAERPAGRSAVAVPEISPAQALSRQVSAFDTLLASLDAGEWHRPVLRDLDVQGLVGHLVGVETHFQDAIDAALAGAQPPAGRSHVISTQPFAAAQAERTPEQTHAEWTAATLRTLDRLGDGSVPPDLTVTLHGLTLPLPAMLLVRAFELWTHEEDIRRATGRSLAPPGPSSLALMTDLAVSLLPVALLAGGTFGGGGTARLVLTGPGGGCWTVPLPPDVDGSRVRIVADVVDFCRLVAARVPPGQMRATLTGDVDLGTRVIQGAPALALD